MTTHWRRKSLGDRIFEISVYCILALFTLAVFYPFYLSVVLSFNNGNAVSTGIYFFPARPTLDNYRFVFSSNEIGHAALISLARTILGTVLALSVTSAFAYAVSKKGLAFRKFYLTMGLITMYFSGGLIPTYLLMRSLKLFDSFLVYILPNLFGMYNAVIFMSFFRELPSSLEESARIDGANDLYIFIRIIFPISLPVYATIALFIGVGHWNSWFDTMMYTQSESLNTLSHLLTKMINRQQFVQNMAGKMSSNIAAEGNGVTSMSLMLATMVITSFPIVVLYPFLQKYFVKGIMIGSVKG